MLVYVTRVKIKKKDKQTLDINEYKCTLFATRVTKGGLLGVPMWHHPWLFLSVVEDFSIIWLFLPIFSCIGNTYYIFLPSLLKVTYSHFFNQNKNITNHQKKPIIVVTHGYNSSIYKDIYIILNKIDECKNTLFFVILFQILGDLFINKANSCGLHII